MTVPPGINTSEVNITLSKQGTAIYTVSITAPLLNTGRTGIYIVVETAQYIDSVCYSLVYTTFSIVVLGNIHAEPLVLLQ